MIEVAGPASPSEVAGDAVMSANSAPYVAFAGWLDVVVTVSLAMYCADRFAETLKVT